MSMIRLTQPNCALRTGVVVGLLWGFLLGFPGRAASSDLEQELLAAAPRVLKFLRQHGYQSVGVLKFRVQKGAGPVMNNAGPINVNLARRLEIALILQDQFTESMKVIENASAVAATIDGANHLTPSGRQKLFEAKYPLAWGDEQLTPDAFLAGEAQLHADRRRITVSVQAFDARSANVHEVVLFDADVKPQMLIEAGESFTLRGGFDGGKVQLAKATLAQPIPVQPAAAEQVLQTTPVVLDVLYDGIKVPVEFRSGQAFVAEPSQGQRVEFKLRRKEASDQRRYAVVLRVNGENTLERQRLPDAECRKWVLEPKSPAITVAGYQMNDRQRIPFRVLSQEESRADEVNYGANVGTISLAVFRERIANDLPPGENLAGRNAADLDALTRGVFPNKRPLNRDALVAQLSKNPNREVIGGAFSFENAQIRRVPFNLDPTPVMSATVVYYKKK